MFYILPVKSCLTRTMTLLSNLRNAHDGCEPLASVRNELIYACLADFDLCYVVSVFTQNFFLFSISVNVKVYLDLGMRCRSVKNRTESVNGPNGQ